MRDTLVRFAFVAAALGSFATLVGTTMTGCATDANSVDACRELESARCARAYGCGIDTAYPLHASNISDVEACQSFYDDACLHGLVTPTPPSRTEVSQCLNEINTGNCNAVINPQSTVACAWLNPPDSGVDASDAADAGTDVVTVVVSVVDSGTDATVDSSTCDSVCASQCVGDPVCIMGCGC